jgi:PAS domain S-box-containing protein
MAAKIEPQSVLTSSDESASTLSTTVATNSSQNPTFQLDRSKTRIASAVTSCASVAVILLGIGVLIGWTADISLLKGISPYFASMKPNTAVCFVLAGVSLWLLRSEGISGLRLRLGQIGAAIVVLIAALTLIEFIFKLNLHIDQFLFPSTSAPEALQPGRMAFATALTFMLLGSALLFINEKTKGRSLTDLLAGSAAAITLLTFLAYLYKVEALYRLVPFTGIAIQTMIGSFILCAGVFFARAKDGFIAVFLSNTAGGTVARRLLPVAILVPPLLGWFRLMGERRGLYEPAFGIAVVASFLIILLVTVIGRTALVIDSAEVVRRRAEDRTRLVVEAAPSAMVMVDEQGRIALVNTRTEKLFGYSRAELLGDPIEKLIPERYLPPQLNHPDNFLAESITRAMGVGRDLYGIRKDGTEIPLEIGLNPIRTDQGNFVLADIIDLTKRKETEDTLRQSEDRALRGKRIWEKTFDAIGEGILVHDHQMRIVRCNIQAAEMLNMTPAEVVGLKFIDAFAILFGRQAADYYLNDKREASSSFDARTSSGQRYIVSIFPIKNPDGDPFSVVMWNDVTMLSEIQEQLGRSRRLASVGQLAAGVAHEVNNPLAAITTCAEAVIRDIRQTEGAKEMAESHQWNYYLEEIVRQSLRCKEITRGLLDLTRQRQARRVLTDLNAIVKQCARVALQRVESNIEFDIVLDENIGNVATDSEMLRQILDNLLTNAIDSLNKGPGRISVSTTREGDRIAVGIADTGQGIPSELLSKIFDPFFSTKGPGKGYGLGLAICLSLAESLGGSITVESKEGVGSKFRLWIPRRAPEQAT